MHRRWKHVSRKYRMKFTNLLTSKLGVAVNPVLRTFTSLYARRSRTRRVSESSTAICIARAAAAMSALSRIHLERRTLPLRSTSAAACSRRGRD